MWVGNKGNSNHIYWEKLAWRYSYMRQIILIVFSMLSAEVCSSQYGIEEFNREVRFINESIHGALVLHRIYESFNQNINKYVDLPSYELNNYGNKDLPLNVYDDPEQWFYDESPNKLYQEIRKYTHNKGSPPIVQNIHNVSQKLNGDRFRIDELSNSSDINELSVIKELYDGLEGVVGYFDNLRASVELYDRLLEKLRYDNALSESQKVVYTAVAEIHFDIKKIIRNLGRDNQSAVIRSLSKIEKEKNWLNVSINDLDSQAEAKSLRSLVGNINNIVAELSNYVNNPSVPEEYALFGKGYYYQNVVLLTLMNRYGNGYVTEFNQFLTEFKWPVLHLTEEPHYLKIIYPETTPKELLDNPLEEITTLEQLRSQPLDPVKAKPIDTFYAEGKEKAQEPQIEKEIPVNITHTHVIYVDSQFFDIQLYDHLIKDGDMVSINVNGEWVYNDISLEKEAKTIQLEVSPNKRNYIMVQAVNEGWRPPNTVGVRYVSNGKVENIIIANDLNSTELIEIKYRQ